MSLSTIIKRNCKTCGKLLIEKSRIKLGSKYLITYECGHPQIEQTLAGVDYSELRSSDGKSLMPFQIEGVKFAEQSNARCLLAHEQGLGKTVMANALIKLHIDELKPVGIVVKSALKRQWMHELVRWVGTKRIQIINSSKEFAVPGLDAYIITYDLLKDDSIFDHVQLKTLIVDECQKIKNHLSGRAKAVQKVASQCEHIIALSGTPIMNNAGEYFTILNILQPTRFPQYQKFLNDYCNYYDGFYSQKIGGLRNPERFKAATEDFILRRTQDEVMPELAKLNTPRKFQHCEFRKEFTKAYSHLQDELEDLYYKDDDSGTGVASIEIMTRMRQLTGISKVFETTEYVTSFLLEHPDKRIAVFAHHHAAIDLLEANVNEWLKDGGYNPAVMHRAGSDSTETIANLKQPNSRVLIASTQSGGEGLDGLQYLCDTLILLERQWNPAWEEQVEKRIIRFGQEKLCNFIYMIASGTIDEMFTELVEQKRAIVVATMDNKVIQWDSSSLMKELMNVLVTTGRKKWAL